MQSAGKHRLVSRRSILHFAAVAAAGTSLPLARVAHGKVTQARFSDNPFTLGVASGFPRRDAVTLWTRLAPKPLVADGGMEPRQVSVHWEVANDDRFRNIVLTGTGAASPEHAHTVHVDVKGLAPARWYWYRFRAGDAWSPMGRTRTADAGSARVARLRFAIASCQNYEQGYYAAHRHLAQEDLDLLLFLGDYIYSDSWGNDLVRQHVARQDARTLDEYRVRYAQYRMDEDLQRIHAQVPWAMVWDDGEVDDDWAAEQSHDLDPAFAARRAAALQAYLEHVPMPWILRRNMNDWRIYHELAYGDLARFYLLDDRLYRSHQVCPKPGKGGGNSVYVDECADLGRKDRTMLGADQERWLDRALSATRQQWNVIAQQTLMAPADLEPGPRTKVATDPWDGYPAARARLLEDLVTHRVANPLVVGGDVHATVVGNLHRAPTDPSTPVIASGFCCTSISSQGAPRGAYDVRLRESPHLKFANSHQRGYMTFDLTPTTCSVAVRLLESEKRSDSGIATAATFELTAGRTGISSEN